MDFHAQQLGWRIAVLPFRSADAQLEHGLALGLAEEVSGALARFRSPRLVATATFWDGAGPVADSPSRARASQLDYIVDGTMNISGKDVQIDVRLLDVVLDFEVIWAGRFDGRLADLYSLQVRLASAIVAQIEPDAAVDVQEASLIRTGVADAHHAGTRRNPGNLSDEAGGLYARAHIVGTCHAARSGLCSSTYLDRVLEHHGGRSGLGGTTG